MAGPHIPHGVFGKVVDSSGLAVENADVNITDMDLNQSLSALTNVDGEFARDLFDLESQWSNGDRLKTECNYRGYRQVGVKLIDANQYSDEIVFDDGIVRILMVM